MAKETSSKTFKNLVGSPIGIIAEFIVSRIANKVAYEPLKHFFKEIQTGKTPPMSNPEYYSSNDIEWIKPSDIGKDMIISGSAYISNKAVVERKATIYKPDTVLFNCIGNLGRLGILKKQASSNQQITGILFIETVLPEFVYYYFLPREVEFYKQSSQTTLPIINQKGLGNLDFICPDISLQKEIVRYLDYCKRCLDEVIYPTNSNFDLGIDILDFSTRTFNAYYAQRSLLMEYEFQLNQLEYLNQAILQEAVQGKLVKQDPKDEPAIELFKRIKAEKEKSGKREKPLSPIRPEDIPFEIPENWVWCKLGELFEIVRGSSPRPKGDPRYFSKVRTEYHWITIADFAKHSILNNLKDTSQFLTKEGSKHSRKVTSNDLLIAASGVGSVGKSSELGITGFIYDGIMAIKNIPNQTLITYLAFYLKVKELEIYSIATGANWLNINTELLRNYLLPLPSISEQKRIVVEIEKQLAKTKQLKENIIANQQATEHLLKALLH